MGTTQLALTPGDALLPTANAAAPVENQGTNFPVRGLSFSTGDLAYFDFPLLKYGSGNITATVFWYADTATSGDVVFGASLACLTPNSDTQDIETKSFATQNTATDTHLGTTGQRLHSVDITISNLDSAANGDIAFIRLERLASGNTMSGEAIVTDIVLSYSDT